MAKKKSVINLNSQVYYQGKYWNDIPRVLEYMCENFTGDKHTWWPDAFLKNYGQFEHALFLNCGDGRNEIEFYDRGIAKRITAFDVSPDLIKQAKKRKGRRKITFFVADANKITFKKNEFDLIVNVAALHHVQYLNRLMKQLAKALKPDGYVVNFDYVGSHRNQYPVISWLLATVINIFSPRSVRKKRVGYAYIPMMLATDPTEAIHSELIEQYLKRYFTITENHPTGGGIAYQLLTHNDSLNTASAKELLSYVNAVLFFDKWLVKCKLAPNLFSYIVAKAAPDSLRDSTVNKKWQKDEDLREELSSYNQGTYSFFEYLQLVKHTSGLRNKVLKLYEYIKTTPLWLQYFLHKLTLT